MELKINEEFKNLIPPLTEEELKGLETSLKAEGCRDPIVVLEDGAIIDGHNRYTMCQEHNIEFKTLVNTELKDDLDVKLWMINNQFSRRNLPTETRLALAYQFKGLEEEKAKAKARQLGNLKQFTEVKTEETSQSTDSALVHTREELDTVEEANDLPASAPVHTPEEKTKGRTLEAIAKMAGVSARTADQYDKIQRKGTDEQKEEVASGEASIKKVYTQIQRAERLETNKVAVWPKGKYRVIYADPPWQYGDERSGGNHGGAVDHYPTMSMQELYDLSVSDITEDDAVLFLWGTSPLLEESLSLMKAWGFKYKTHFVWDKVKHNMGHYNSVRHELLFIATKGSCTPDNIKLFDSVQSIERSDKHSEKPEEFRKIIETLYTYGNKIELFARKKVEGWEVFGNEVSSQAEPVINQSN